MKKPLISIVLCVYNPRREQLVQAVESMICQTFTDWEMILYDDGSAEEFADFICKTAKRDIRIRYIRNQVHHSLAYGLNQSIKLAVGRYIARMDADDISDPARLQKEYCFLEEHLEYSFVGCNLILIGETGEEWGKRSYPEIPQKEDFLRYLPYAHPSILFRRSVFAEYGGYRKGEHECRGEDYEFFMRLYAQGVFGYNLQESLLFYRESMDSYKRRKLKYQLQEMGIRFRGFRKLKLKGRKTIWYIVKPLAIWGIPKRFVKIWKQKRG